MEWLYAYDATAVAGVIRRDDRHSALERFSQRSDVRDIFGPVRSVPGRTPRTGEWQRREIPRRSARRYLAGIAIMADLHAELGPKSLGQRTVPGRAGRCEARRFPALIAHRSGGRPAPSSARRARPTPSIGQSCGQYRVCVTGGRPQLRCSFVADSAPLVCPHRATVSFSAAPTRRCSRGAPHPRDRRRGVHLRPHPQPDGIRGASSASCRARRSPCWCSVLASTGAVLFLMPAGDCVLHYGAVLREESYLEGRFGDAYRSYKAAVPRYGWRPGFAGPLEAVEPLGVVHQDALARRLVRHPDRDLIDQVAVVRHRRLQQHVRPVRAPHQAVGRGGDQRVRERRDVVVGRLAAARCGTAPTAWPSRAPT